MAELERNIGIKASLVLAPMQAGDVTHTFADIEASRRDLGFEPSTPIEAGLEELRRLVPRLSRPLTAPSRQEKTAGHFWPAV